MVGVLIVLSPRLTHRVATAAASVTEAFGAMLVLGGAVFAALAQVFVRKLVKTESTAAIVFWFSLTATLLSLVTLPFGWVWPTPLEAALLVGAGLLGGVGQILLTSSYREADASLVAPFDYASMLFALAHRLLRLRRGADLDDARRGGADRDGGHPDHLARTATGPRSAPGNARR